MSMEQNKVLFYFNDPGHICTCINEHNPRREQRVTRERLQGAVTEATDAGFDVFVNEIYGMVPWYPSRVLPMREHLDWFYGEFGGQGRYCFLDYAEQGEDFVSQQEEMTHAAGKEYYLSYRMNDLHNLNLADDPKKAKVMWISRFWAEHPEYRIGEPQNQLGHATFMLDFRHEAVREYKMAMIRELIETYNMDGFLLDFMRAPAYFNLNKTTKEERIGIITDFVAAVKGLLEEREARTGKPCRLGVVIPLQDARYGDLGLDVDALCGVGVDTFIFWDYYFAMLGYSLVERVKKAHPEVRVCVMISQATSHRPKANQVYRYTVAEQFYTCAYTAYGHGADGMAIFNFPFYRNWQYDPDLGFGYAPPFEIMKHLKDTEFLASAPQHYFHGVHYNHLIYDFSLSRVALRQEAPSFTFRFEMRLPRDGWRDSFGVLRLETREASDTRHLTVTLNGEAVEEIAPVPERLASPYENLIGDTARLKYYRIPAGLLREGDAVFEVTSRTAGEPIAFTYVELVIR